MERQGQVGKQFRLFKMLIGSLIWICTVCPSLSVQIFRVNAEIEVCWGKKTTKQSCNEKQFTVWLLPFQELIVPFPKLVKLGY